MIGNKKLLVTLTATAVMIIIGVGLMIWAMWNEQEVNVIDVRLSDGASAPVEFNDLSMLPGDSTDYTIRFSSYSSDQYHVTLDFLEDEDDKASNTLKHFVKVRIDVDGKTVCDDLLKNAIDGKVIDFPVDVGKGVNTKVQVTYYLPDDVGNEAKGAKADFKLHIHASNEDLE